MISNTSLKLAIDTIDWETCSPTYPLRFNGPGYLYCVWCEHFVRQVWYSQAAFKCADCGRALATSGN